MKELKLQRAKTHKASSVGRSIAFDRVLPVVSRKTKNYLVASEGVKCDSEKLIDFEFYFP